MKILIISDTHGEYASASRIIRQEKPDHVIHLGDCLRDAEDLSREFPILPICKVPGNNDWFSDEPKEKVISLGGTKIFLCHGHTTGVKSGTDVQLAKALHHHCAVSLYGHTHRPFLAENEDIMLLNPGSLTFGGTYAVLTLSPGQPPQGKIKTDF